MNEDALVFSQIPQLVGFDFVFFNMREATRGHAAGITIRPLADFSLSEKICAFNRARLVRTFENHPIAKIQGQHLRLFLSKRRNEGR